MIYIIIGTKGQFIKMFPVMKLMDKRRIPYIFVHTSQHYRFIEDNRKRLRVRKPDIYLTVKKKDLSNIQDVLRWAPKVLWKARHLSITPRDYVLLHGDTETTFLSLLIAKYFRAKTIHIESGARTGNLFEPFPEELIRIITDRFSDICFSPFPEDAANLMYRDNVYYSFGNTVFDSVKYALTGKPSVKVKKLLKRRNVIFLIHRKENLFDKERLSSIMAIFELILQKGYCIIWPMHTNTRYELEKKGYWKKIDQWQRDGKLTVIYFLDYIDFMHLVKQSEFIASDGGGLQQETYVLNRPMLVLRKHIENKMLDSKTAYLSKLDLPRVRYFLKHFKKFINPHPPTSSPATFIVDVIEKLP